MVEYDLVAFVEQAWRLRCTRCTFEGTVWGRIEQQAAAEQFIEDGWELREGPRVLCPACAEELGESSEH